MAEQGRDDRWREERFVTVGEHTFCRAHSSYFCPCVRPDMYDENDEQDRKYIAGWNDIAPIVPFAPVVQAPTPIPPVTWKYVGRNPTESEQESGETIEAEDHGPIQPGSPKHRMLFAHAHRGRCTAYDASYMVTGDWHAVRRESERLEKRGFLRKDGHLPNRAPRGREKVDAFIVTPAGREELRRLEK